MKAYKIMLKLKSSQFAEEYSAEVDTGYIVEAVTEADALEIVNDEPFYFLQKYTGLTFYLPGRVLDFNDSTQKQRAVIGLLYVGGETVSEAVFISRLMHDCERCGDGYSVVFDKAFAYVEVAEDSSYSIRQDEEHNNCEVVLCGSTYLHGSSRYDFNIVCEVMIATGYTTNAQNHEARLDERFSFLFDAIRVKLIYHPDVNRHIFQLEDKTKKQQARIIGFRYNQKEVSRESFGEIILNEARDIDFGFYSFELIPLQVVDYQRCH